MPIVVTGAGGFVGRYLLAALHREGHAVVAVDHAPLHGAPAERLVCGDIGDPAIRAEILRDGCTALMHLATVPGGAAEANPQTARHINVEATEALLELAGRAGGQPRVVFASSIAVYGAPLPPAGVDDHTPLSPHMFYGAHKAMMELARPRGPSGVKSAFMSDVFHAVRANTPLTCPVSADATIWAQSLECCTRNLLTALSVDTADLPPTRAVTLPAQTLRMGDLVAEIARQCGRDAGLVRYAPDPAVERVGFARDATMATLVEQALATLG